MRASFVASYSPLPLLGATTTDIPQEDVQRAMRQADGGSGWVSALPAAPALAPHPPLAAFVVAVPGCLSSVFMMVCMAATSV